MLLTVELCPQGAFLFLYFNLKKVFCMYVWYAFGYAFAHVCGVYANAHLLVFGGQTLTSGVLCLSGLFSTLLVDILRASLKPRTHRLASLPC